MVRPGRDFPDRVLSPAQAAALGRVTTDTLRAWEKRGLLRKLQTGSGKHRRYLESEVLEIARNQRGGL
jgi:DNA-binding transcriptional MerR regulator